MSPEQFAREVVEKLRAAGYEALWAGGCVRDRLLGRVPKDYDVATSATPDEVRNVFSPGRTLAVGAAFGVMMVRGPRGLPPVEVATFRQDVAYSDGRHPDAVIFSTPEHDAQRRDFTINGLFYDPIAEQVIDYVGGVEDLKREIVRAIGNPAERFDEDKLRMLRAVRFTAAFRFTLDAATLAAIQTRPGELAIVSAERIAMEMERMITHPHRRAAVELLHEAGLLEVALPESRRLFELEDRRRWEETLRVLEHLGERDVSFPLALAALARRMESDDEDSMVVARRIGARWKLPNEIIDRAAWIVQHETFIRQARGLQWPFLQRILIDEGIDDAIELAAAAAAVVDPLENNHIAYCREKLALPRGELDPPALLDGNDLLAMGIPAGPIYRTILTAVRDAQLENKIATREEAKQMAELLASYRDNP